MIKKLFLFITLLFFVFGFSFIEIYFGQVNVFVQCMLLCPICVILFYRFDKENLSYVIVLVVSLSLLHILSDYYYSRTTIIGAIGSPLWVYWITWSTLLFFFFDFKKELSVFFGLVQFMLVVSYLGSEIYYHHQTIDYFLFLLSSILLIVIHYTLYKIQTKSNVRENTII